MVKKDITINDLAIMVQKGFEEVHKSLTETAKQTDLENLRNEVREGFKENQNLKDRVKVVEDALAID
jgi:hypothetical protein